MADDPAKKRADAKRISQQPHEQAYQRRKRRERNEASDNSSTRSGRRREERTGPSREEGPRR